MSGALWIGVCILAAALVLEIFVPAKFAEGFQAATAAPEPVAATDGKPNLITNQLLRRGDIGPGREQGGYVQDRRYFSGYANVQRYGVKNDFCRMVTLSGEEGLMFACALAGTTNTSPVAFRTRAAKQGFRLGRDDYMRDILGDGRDAYCRILKDRDGTYQPLCRRADDTSFLDRDELDTDPPEYIKTMMDFYSGCHLWLRMRDDLLDYVDTAIIQTAGGMTIDQTPNPTVTRGLHFNGRDQFLRFGDTADLTLGNRIPMRTVRAFSVWVKFDEFTNNAHIFDFGDAAGKNNTFLGILGKGDAEGSDQATIRPGAACPETTVPTTPSGAQFCPELRPQDLLFDPNETACTGSEVAPRALAPLQTRPAAKPATGATRATLQFEIWDGPLRKVQIKVNKAIPLQKWTHIVITAKGNDAMRPDLHVYINGNLAFVQEQGYLPQAKVTTNNYLGKSNWMNDTSQYELRDELFSGSMFDFRMYTSPMSEAKVKRTLQWGLGKLGLDTSFESVSG